MSELTDKREPPDLPEIKESDQQGSSSGDNPTGSKDKVPPRWAGAAGGSIEAVRTADIITEDELKVTGHGNDRHGPDTTREQHVTRVQTGEAPDGAFSPTERSTRFDSQSAQLEAVNKAKALVDKWDAAGEVDHYRITKSGREIPQSVTLVVNDRPGGYGSGVKLEKGPDDRPLPGPPFPVTDTGQDPNALVLLQYNGETKRWDPITQYPTNLPVTPEKR